MYSILSWRQHPFHYCTCLHFALLCHRGRPFWSLWAWNLYDWKSLVEIWSKMNRSKKNSHQMMSQNSHCRQMSYLLHLMKSHLLFVLCRSFTLVTIVGASAKMVTGSLACPWNCSQLACSDVVSAIESVGQGLLIIVIIAIKVHYYWRMGNQIRLLGPYWSFSMTACDLETLRLGLFGSCFGCSLNLTGVALVSRHVWGCCSSYPFGAGCWCSSPRLQRIVHSGLV